MNKFVLNKKANGEFRFNLVAENDKIILFSKPFSTKSSCLRGIELVKKYTLIDSSFELEISSTGKPYFNLKDEKGTPIARSNLYDTEVSRKKGIALVKITAPVALVDEQIIKEQKEKPAEIVPRQKYPKDEFEAAPKKNDKMRSHYSKK